MATAKQIKEHCKEKIEEWSDLLHTQGELWDMAEVQRGEIQLLEGVMHHSNKKDILSYLKDVKKDGESYINDLGDMWESYDLQVGELQAVEYLLDWIRCN